MKCKKHVSSMILYYQTCRKHEKKTKIALQCLCNKVETLKKELITKEHSLIKEKEEAISSVWSFWRDHLIEGSSSG